MLFIFFKHKTAYEMRISDWSSDVCSSDLERLIHDAEPGARHSALLAFGLCEGADRDEAALRGIGEPAAPEGHELVVARIVDRLRLARRLHMLEDRKGVV